jgi:hypothetical protein
VLVCERWLHSFEAFLKDVGEKPTPQHSLGRFGDVGNYEPDNVRWMTKKEQVEEQKAKVRIFGRKPMKYMITPEQMSEIHRKSGHVRWHVRRSTVKADCLYCVPVVESQVA